ncbi:MAG: hypothetical protein U5J78_01110 [Parasphingorhabdus sp.]|nr:hypothetical protein [Parasphingorhabdus sp.]
MVKLGTFQPVDDVAAAEPGLVRQGLRPRCGDLVDPLAVAA